MNVFNRLSRTWLSVPPSGSSWHEVMRPATRQMIRVLISVAAAWLVGMALHLQETIWALVTALIVTQSSIVQTISTARDQISGTVIGGIAGTLALLIQLWTHTVWMPFWIMLTPLVFLSAIQPRLRFACITLVIVFLFPSNGSPFLPLLTRLTAITIGVLVSMGVSFLVLHTSARRQAFHTSARLLRRLDAMVEAALDSSSSWSQIEKRNQDCVALLLDLEGAVEEARRERLQDLKKRDPVLAALPQLMRRLLNDTMLVARAIATGRDAGNTGLRSLHHDLSHMLRTLAYSCEQQILRPQKRHPHQPDGQDILDLLPLFEEQSRPEMRFVMSLYREDIERAVGVIISGDATAIQGL
ncbi:FUSC family protein [Gluconobacter wancherniae]|uniref:FUSC family protein n=1 Tax=Gluconobacter wancherniae TaxID=1307955 RepID=UPI001B8B02EC|nr:FUSC family protein [Gluconobacter wancherniae]MBS1062592.1 FUSC family protein [Gluconobacter wancherniae]